MEGGPDERRCARADAAAVDGLVGPIHGFFLFFYLINRCGHFSRLEKDLFTVTVCISWILVVLGQAKMHREGRGLNM